MEFNQTAGQEPEQRLWTAVITRTVEDWMWGPLRTRRQAEAFLFEDETDFPVVCESAGLNPEVLRTRLLRMRTGQVIVHHSVSQAA